MTQLILDTSGAALSLPESRRGGYACAEEPLSVDVEMASGRTVRELRGAVYTVSYQYGYLTGEERTRFLAACEKGWREPISCSFLLPDGTLAAGSFLVTGFTFPKFMWSRREADGTETALWGDFKVELREVTPHA